MRPFFSLIIPYHNPKIEEVERLFNSLSTQGIKAGDLEIIAVDDASDNKDAYRQYIIDNYLNYGILKFIDTNTDIHCPGNTRRAGMAHVTGQWLFFCDQDDYFEINILDKVKDYLISLGDEVLVLATQMWTYGQEEGEYRKNLSYEPSWLHGKWYNVDNLINKYRINFKKDLKTHEDVYFNSCINAQLYKLKSEIKKLDIKTYRWVDNPESLTRRPYDDRGYFYENFQDYIRCVTEPFWAEAKAGDGYSINQVMMGILHCYFYYEAASYYCGPIEYRDILNYITILLERMIKELDFNPNDIINYIYIDAEKYQKVLVQCEISTGPFIPKTSFRDFIYKLAEKIYKDAED